jgi:PAS domain S-box-containing protein
MFTDRRDASGEQLLEELRVLRARLAQAEDERAQAEAERHAERKRAEEALRASEQRYRALAENSAVGFWHITPDGHTIYVNPAMCRLLEIDGPDDLVGLTYHHFATPEGLEAIRREYEKRVRGIASTYEAAMVSRNGRRLNLLVSGAPLFDGAGRLQSLIGTFLDISERQRLEEQLREAHKMEAVGRLAGGIAHDFNNLLTVVTGYGEQVLAQLGPGDPLHPPVQEVLKAARLAADLTGQLLAFGRRTILAPRRLDLNAVLRDMHKMLRRLLGEEVKLVTALGPGPGHVQVDPVQLHQVVINLALNARDAMPQGGRLTLATARVDLDEPAARRFLDARPGSYMVLEVTDTGCGMSDEVRAHLFEPFFTTKEVGRGTGLGLSTTYGIVKQSGGHIEVASAPGHGSTFKVYLPRAEAAPAEEGGRPPPAAPRGLETVLLAEDEEMVRSLVRQVLRQAGYTVLEAANGAEALAVCQQHPGPIHLLLTDVVMPGMSGRALAERAARLRPDLPVLYMSGYTDDDVVRHGVMQAAAAFLQKPFRLDDLLRKVREVLDR